MDNHSNDSSYLVAKKIAKTDERACLIRLSRNFGYQANIYTGFINTTGDAVIQLDADGEDDPLLIRDFIKKWEEGFEVVYGIRTKRAESFWLTILRKLFYRILNLCSEINIPNDSGDFRLLDRKVINELKEFRESSLYLRGLVSYIGFNQTGISYERRPRYSGVSKFSLFGYFSFAIDGITAFSKKPLTYVTWSGFLLSILSILGMIFYFGLYLTMGVAQAGFTTLVLIILFLAGIQLFCVGLIGLYIGRIFDEVKMRPRSIIESRFSLQIER
jgi:dolichol-phosphate mannosyltransferase